MLRSIANRLVMAPSQHFIDPKERQRVAIQCGSDEIEAWVYRGGSKPADWFILKFPGAGGRGERVSLFPGEHFSDAIEVWGINPPGYGTSTGKACVSKMPAVAQSAWHAIKEAAGDRPIIVSGISLGAMYALHVAARFNVAGLILRHPAPVHQLIKGKYDGWSFGMASRSIGKQIPNEVDAGANAAKCTAPAFISIAESDRVIPPKFQLQLAERFRGPVTTFILKDGQHHSIVDDRQQVEYDQLVEHWAAEVKN